MFELGNDTISYNLHDFVVIYIKPLYENIINAAKVAPVLLLEGTPFDCLKSLGVRKSKDRNSEDVTVSKSNYILCMASLVHSKVQFTSYGYLYKRNLESIRIIITTDVKFKTLVTDGFSGYELLMEEHPGVESCVDDPNKARNNFGSTFLKSNPNLTPQKLKILS